jgi:glycine oxidase
MKLIAIVGMGLAGACMAWQLWRRGVAFRIIDSGRPGSSQVAAGLIHPVTGKQCAVAENYTAHYEEAEQFYRDCENCVSQSFFHRLEVVRLLDAMEQKKRLPKFHHGTAAAWVTSMGMDPRWPGEIAVVLRGAARLHVAAFLQASREFFTARGLMEECEWREADSEILSILCEGAMGLMRGSPVSWNHRCAKGEILTVHAPSWKQERLVVGRGWLVPVGDDCYKIGSTYEWNQLDDQPSKEGLRHLEALARHLGGEEYEILAQDAGIRPILRKSQPVAGMVGEHVCVLNGLGSKGSLSAPWASRAVVDFLLDHVPLPSGLCIDHYFATMTGH